MLSSSTRRRRWGRGSSQGEADGGDPAPERGVGTTFMPPAGGYHSLGARIPLSQEEGPRQRATKWRRGTAGASGFSRSFPRGTNELRAREASAARRNQWGSRAPAGGPPPPFLPASPRQRSPQPIARRVEARPRCRPPSLAQTLEAPSQWGVEGGGLATRARLGPAPSPAPSSAPPPRAGATGSTGGVEGPPPPTHCPALRVRPLQPLDLALRRLARSPARPLARSPARPLARSPCPLRLWLGFDAASSLPCVCRSRLGYSLPSPGVGGIEGGGGRDLEMAVGAEDVY